MTLINAPRDFILEVEKWNIVWHNCVTIFGRNNDVDTWSVPEDIRNWWGTYTWFDATAAETITFTSSAWAADAGKVVEILFWLDWSYNEYPVAEQVTLNWSGIATTTNTYIRMIQARVLSPWVNAWEITATQSGSWIVMMVMPAQTNRSHICAYTTPAGKVMQLERVFASLTWNWFLWSDSAYLDLVCREPGGWFESLLPIQVSAYSAANIRICKQLPPQTDLVWRCRQVDNNNTIITASFEIEIIDSNLVNNA